VLNGWMRRRECEGRRAGGESQRTRRRGLKHRVGRRQQNMYSYALAGSQARNRGWGTTDRSKLGGGFKEQGSAQGNLWGGIGRGKHYDLNSAIP
jgi:hypothetical protein